MVKFDFCKTQKTRFRDMLQSLEELPLGVGKLSVAGAGFSYTGGQSTEIAFNNSSKSVQDLVLEFDWSSLWPRESEDAIKVEFYIRFS